jgi:hypothetical protein
MVGASLQEQESICCPGGIHELRQDQRPAGVSPNFAGGILSLIAHATPLDFLSPKEPGLLWEKG